MKVTLIKPTLGRLEARPYVDRGRMEPLELGVIAALTPAGVDVQMYDDRFDVIDRLRRADRPGGDHRADIHGAASLRNQR